MSKLDEARNTAQEQLATFAKAIEKFKVIDVNTLISDLEITNEGKLQRTNSEKPPRGLVTRIDMFEGDIAHTTSGNLSPEELANLEKIHSVNVALGQKIFSDNIKFVFDTVERFTRSSE